jgi:hypothetical protein
MLPIISYLLPLNKFYLTNIRRIRDMLYCSLKFKIIPLVSYVVGIAVREVGLGAADRLREFFG